LREEEVNLKKEIERLSLEDNVENIELNDQKEFEWV